jgi:hypothetical protein
MKCLSKVIAAASRNRRNLAADLRPWRPVVTTCDEVLVDDLPSWTSFPKKPLLQQLRNQRLPPTSEVEKMVQKKAQTKENKLVRLSKNQSRKEKRRR